MRKLGLLGFALLLAACGEVGVEGGGSTLPPRDTTPTEFLEIRSEGGFAPVELILSRGPTYTLLSNGDLIAAGPTVAIYPGPLLPNYQVLRLTDEQMAAVNASIEDIGLAEITDESDDSATSFVADATTEVVTLWDEDGTHRYSVYALGIDSLDPNDPEDPRTRAFQDLVEYLGTIDMSDAMPYQPERVRVIATDSQMELDDEFVDVRDWPLGSEDPSEWASIDMTLSCKAFDGHILEVFEDATSATTWDLAGTEMVLYVRPLMPGEPDCPI